MVATALSFSTSSINTDKLDPGHMKPTGPADANLLTVMKRGSIRSVDWSAYFPIPRGTPPVVTRAKKFEGQLWPIKSI